MPTTLLVGTSKGLFLVYGDGQGWSVDGPHCDLWPINHAIGSGDRIWAGGGGPWAGAGVWRSDDRGQTWSLAHLAWGEMDEALSQNADMRSFMGRDAPAPAPLTGQIDSIWSLCHHEGSLYAGTRPARFLRSTDSGETWSVQEALTNHPSASDWQPGGVGLTLHTIVPGTAPGQVWIGISAAGVFATDDGGHTWDRRNQLGNDGEIGHCVHNMQRAPGHPDWLYQQNHSGVFRSQDGGRSWSDITRGLPSTFGFPMGVHPRDPEKLWVIPLNGDIHGRFPPDAAAKVWSSDDGGTTWVPRTRGLPQTSCYFTVLRQAMAIEDGDKASVYFGTNTGSIFASHDEGESWDEIARHLPTVFSVEVLS